MSQGDARGKAREQAATLRTGPDAPILTVRKWRMHALPRHRVRPDRSRLSSPAAAQPAKPVVQLVPHRAVYDLSLLRSQGSRGLDSARGRIAMDFGGDACDGYTLNYRQVTVLNSNETGARTVDTQTATFEAGDGQSMRFKTTSTSGMRRRERRRRRCAVAARTGPSTCSSSSRRARVSRRPGSRSSRPSTSSASSRPPGRARRPSPSRSMTARTTARRSTTRWA